MKIVLISCVSKKKSYACRADEIYDSPLFKYAYKYAKMQNPDRIFILSAKYGLLNIDDYIEPYNETLNNKNNYECKIWADNVLLSLGKKTDLEKDEFIFLAGEKYRKYLLSYIKKFEIPLYGLKIGEQLKYYKEYVGGNIDE